MSFGYEAEQWEAELLREIFGEKVDSVTFYDAESGNGFIRAEAFDAEGREIDMVLRRSTTWDADHGGMTLGDIPAERGETVKFWLWMSGPGRASGMRT